MCCSKNRGLALFGAVLAATSGSAIALTGSHLREPAQQVAPQTGPANPELNKAPLPTASNPTAQENGAAAKPLKPGDPSATGRK